MTAPSVPDAEQALERAHDDPRFEAALREAYRGRHNVLDALWWAAHPLTDSPRGVSDPGTELKPLQRAAYARASDLTQASENQQRLRDAQGLLADDAKDLADAVAAVTADDAMPATPQVKVAADAAPRPPRKIVLPILSGVALLAAILVVPALSQQNADADPEPVNTTQPAERVQTDIVMLGSVGDVTDPLAILERPQTDTDLPPNRLPLPHDRESFRALPDLVGHVQLYLARDTELDGVCLVVVRDDNSAMSGCTTDDEFSERGLDIGSPNRYPISDTMTILTENFSLLPNGDFRYVATARVTGQAAFLGPNPGSVVAPDLD